MDRKETNMTEPNPWQAPEQPVPAPALPQAGEEQPVTGCSFKDAIIRYWKGYVRFRGRASRSEYWWAMLFTFLVWFAFSLLDQSGSGLGALFSLLSACWGLATILPTIAISWRRLHDADKPGTFMFIVYGLYLIGYIMFFFGLFGAIGGAVTGLSNGDASLLSGALGMGSIGLILIVAGLITNIVFMCLPSNPDGARFD